MNETPQSGREPEAELAAAYRAAAPAEPPAALDDKIRAAARRAVGAGPQRPAPLWRRWQKPLSIAAVLLLCVSLVAVMRDEGGELTRVPRAEAPAPIATESARATAGESAIPRVELALPAGSSGLGLKPSGSGADRFGLAGANSSVGIRAPAASSPEAPRDADRLASAAPARVQELKAAQPASPAIADRMRGRLGDSANMAAPPETAKFAAPAAAPRESEADRSARAEAPVAARIAAAPARLQAAPASIKADSAEPPAVLEKSEKQVADTVSQMSQLPPEKWLDRLEELRRAGRLDEARAGLSAFRSRYPDYSLPPSLQNLARP